MRGTDVEYSNKCQAEYCTATFAKRVLAEVFFVKLNNNQNGTNICICLC